MTIFPFSREKKREYESLSQTLYMVHTWVYMGQRVFCYTELVTNVGFIPLNQDLYIGTLK